VSWQSVDIERLAAKCERLRIDIATLKREAFDNPAASGSRGTSRSSAAPAVARESFKK